jgi:STAS domain
VWSRIPNERDFENDEQGYLRPKDVHFLASRGMRTLVMSDRLLREKGGKLVLVNPQALVEEVMKTTGIDTIVPIAPDLSAAIALFRWNQINAEAYRADHNSRCHPLSWKDGLPIVLLAISVLQPQCSRRALAGAIWPLSGESGHHAAVARPNVSTLI